MWFWQRKSMHKRLNLWAKLVTISISFHFFFLFSLFVWYRDPFCALSLTIRPDMLKHNVMYTIAIEEPPKEELPEKEHMQSEEKLAKQEPEVPKKEPQAAAQKTEPPKKVEQKKEAQPEQASPKQEVVADRYADLYKEISQKWSPPPGIPSETACELTMQIDANGNVIDMQILKSSGVLVFDVAAQGALDELNYPQWAWGKAISLTFSMEMA